MAYGSRDCGIRTRGETQVYANKAVIWEIIQGLTFVASADNNIRKKFGKNHKIDTRIVIESGWGADDIVKALGFTHVLEMGMLVIARWEEDITIEIAKQDREHSS